MYRVYGFGFADLCCVDVTVSAVVSGVSCRSGIIENGS